MTESRALVGVNRGTSTNICRLTALTPLISKIPGNSTVPELFDSEVERGSFMVKVAVLIEVVL